jgi:phosphosulfolactate phosphohydrolase-like enzyme
VRSLSAALSAATKKSILAASYMHFRVAAAHATGTQMQRCVVCATRSMRGCQHCLYTALLVLQQLP